MSSDENALLDILADLRTSLAAEAYFATLSLTFAIPDICAALEDEKGVTNSAKYAKWWDIYMEEYAEDLPGANAYKVRCGFVHQGKPTRADLPWDHIAFGLGPQKRWVISGNTVDGIPAPDIILLGIGHLVDAISQGAEEWLRQNSDQPSVIKNLRQLMRKGLVTMPFFGEIDAVM